ncbi:MAG TPA: GH1 family beta-glucosidase [Verrucomicrobiae bacterium]|nr:GH1 family beta-glucosidase [Verrucomicrobiae bacterium]
MPPLITPADLTRRRARPFRRGEPGQPRPAYSFPRHFVWGVSTAAPQIEGAAAEDGKGESIWDRLAKTRRIDSPSVACDHYHRYRDDAELLKTLGIPNYRLSIAWPRIFPQGDGKVNLRGLEFYDRLVDTLLENGVTPWITLYHWDLPQALEDRGGWRVRSTAQAFGRYAAFVVQRLGDRVKHWMSLNEILRFVPCGYGFGCDAPGATEPAAVVNQIYHHTLLAHGYAVDAVRRFGGRGARIGLAHNPPTPVPVTETEEDIEAARAEYIRANDQVMGPLYLGEYPEAFLNTVGADAPRAEQGDLELISQKTDFLGLNVYFGEFVRRGGDGRVERIAFPGQYPKADISWLNIMPQAMYWAVRHAREAYGVQTLYITENGAPYFDRLLANGEIHDLGRREYLRNHLISLHRAIHEGFDVRGYFVWSLLDNYEWIEGYSKRFGIVYVDYKTLRRTPKLSGYWYSKVIQSNAVV